MIAPREVERELVSRFRELTAGEPAINQLAAMMVVTESMYAQQLAMRLHKTPPGERCRLLKEALTRLSALTRHLENEASKSKQKEIHDAQSANLHAAGGPEVAPCL